jgi:hypothetical protein
MSVGMNVQRASPIFSGKNMVDPVWDNSSFARRDATVIRTAGRRLEDPARRQNV